jgi:hypothetical protein
MAADFQDRLLDELMPLKGKIKEEPAIVADVSPAAVFMAAPRLSATRTPTTAPAIVEDAPAAVFKAAPRLSAVGTPMAAAAKATAPNDDKHGWRGTCAICMDMLPLEGNRRTFYECCCKRLCKACSEKCDQYDTRCPLCRAPVPTSDAEALRRVQKHVDKGNVEAQTYLARMYQLGHLGLKKSPKRAFQLYDLAAAQGHVNAQFALGTECYSSGQGTEINYKTAAHWLRSAAEHGHPGAQRNLGEAFYNGKGVAQSYDEAVRWFRLAAVQGEPDALFNLGACYQNGEGAPRDLYEALRCFKRAAAKENAGAAAAVEKLEAHLAAARPGPPT